MEKIWAVNAGVCVPEVEEHEGDGAPGHHWYPALDRRAALRLLGMSSMAAVVGCGAGGTVASGPTTTTSTGTTATTTTLIASANSIAQNGSLTLTATVSPSAATGTVTFYAGTTALGSGALTSGVAMLTTASIGTVGTVALTAVYGGSTAYAGSTSAALSLSVTASTACGSTLEGEEGPYFVDDSATGYLRTNILSNLDGTKTQAGVPLTLTLYVYDSKKSCVAMSGVQVDILAVQRFRALFGGER